MITTRKSTTGFEALPSLRSEASGLLQVETRVSGKTGSALSPPQERLWFLNQINPLDTTAVIGRAVRITRTINRGVLERSLQALIYRHEILRTTFVTTQLYAGIDSTPVQLVAEAGRFPLDVVNVSETAEQEVDDAAARVMRERMSQPFDLSLGPLIRATLITVAEQSHILLLAAHRIVADEESLNILFCELWQVYNASGDLDAAELPPLPASYAVFAASELQSLQSDAAATAIDYWRRTLAGAPPVVELPSDQSAVAVGATAAANTPIVFDAGLVQRLRALAEREHISARTLLLAAYAILVWRYSNQEDMV